MAEQLTLPPMEEDEVSPYLERVYECPYCGARELTWDERDTHVAAKGRCDSYYL